MFQVLSFQEEWQAAFAHDVMKLRCRCLTVKNIHLNFPLDTFTQLLPLLPTMDKVSLIQKYII